MSERWKRTFHLSNRFLSVLLIIGFTVAQTPTSITIRRDQTTLRLTNFGLFIGGARSIPAVAGCEEGIVQTIFYDPDGGVQLEIGRTTSVQATAAILRRPQGQLTENDDESTIEMLDARLVFDERPPCIQSVQHSEEQRVRLTQGSATILGTKFFLNRETRMAEVHGPILVERPLVEEPGTLTITADHLQYDLENEVSILSGDVLVTSPNRTSEAEKLVLDEENGVATLTGSPARSVEGRSSVEGERLLYYLDSGDVVVLGGLKGVLEIDELD